MERAKQDQLPLPLFDLCSKCGQPILSEPPADPLGEAILRVLRAANGKLVKMALILGFVGMSVERTSVHRRLKLFEAEGKVERDLDHPKLGYRITAKERSESQHRSAA